MKIIPINTKSEDLLEGYDIERIRKINPDVFIYSYEYDGYGGSGFAVWRKGGKWSYQEMGHCSCYGPLENVESSNNMKFTLRQVMKVMDDYGNHAASVNKYLKTYYNK